MPVVTCYTSEPDDEFLRRLEVDVVPDETEIRVEPELWREVLNRLGRLVFECDEGEIESLIQERDELMRVVKGLEEELENLREEISGNDH